MGTYSANNNKRVRPRVAHPMMQYMLHSKTDEGIPRTEFVNRDALVPNCTNEVATLSIVTHDTVR
jgi:hypothetical protein